MKRIKYIAIGSLSVAALLLGMSACSNLDDFASGDGEFAFAASQSAVTVSTRAGSTEQFDQNTRYYLYALVGTDWGKNYLSSTDPTSGSYIVGTESSSHTIDYTGNNKFNGKTLNFYGITENKQDEPTAHPTNTLTITESASSAPTVFAKYPDVATTSHGVQLKVLPDYMWTNLAGQSFKNAGSITLPFIHTTSMLNFLVTENSDAVSQNLTINKIELCDYASGTLNMTTGKFLSSSSETRTSNWYTVFSGSQALTTSSAALNYSADGTAVQPTIFPTRDTDKSTHSLGIRVTLGNGKVYTYWTTEPNLNADNTLNTANPTKAFDFEPNYVYNVQLTITAQALVVTILPTKYGWIPYEEIQSNDNGIYEIGNPVTFGGVVWADRNLGATSADPTKSAMDWERARGWYYQFGRSIPYYVKGTMQDPENINSSSLVSGVNVSDVPTDNWHFLNDGRGKPYPYVYEHFTEGPIMLNKDWGWGYAYDIDGSYDDVSYNNRYDYTNYSAANLAKVPGASGKYNFVFDCNNYDDYPSGPSSCPFDWDYAHGTSATFWNIKSQQPCPKGWRLPTQKEVFTIYPCDPICGDIAFNPTKDTSQGTNIPGQHVIRGYHIYDDIVYTGSDETSSYPVYGTYMDYKTDTYPNRDGIYVGHKEPSTYSGTIYCIKNQGTNKAYRIMWKVLNPSFADAPDSNPRQVLAIYRFPCTSSDDLKKWDSSKNEYVPDYEKYDWNTSHASEVLYLPLSGVVYGRYSDRDNSYCGVALTFPGTQAIYWTSDANTSTNSAYSYRLKIDFGTDTGQRALFTYGLDRRGFGAFIRCVRDDSVVK